MTSSPLSLLESPGGAPCAPDQALSGSDLSDTVFGDLRSSIDAITSITAKDLTPSQQELSDSNIVDSLGSAIWMLNFSRYIQHLQDNYDVSLSSDEGANSSTQQNNAFRRRIDTVTAAQDFDQYLLKGVTLSQFPGKNKGEHTFRTVLQAAAVAFPENRIPAIEATVEAYQAVISALIPEAKRSAEGVASEDPASETRVNDKPGMNLLVLQASHLDEKLRALETCINVVLHSYNARLNGLQPFDFSSQPSTNGNPKN